MGVFFQKHGKSTFYPHFIINVLQSTLYMGEYIDCNKKNHDVPHGFYQSPLYVS